MNPEDDMRIIETRAELQAWSTAERAKGRRIALVPTMGALHAGHLSLVEEARKRADRVIVSIFVNPTQFNDPGDFAGYPRVLDEDLSACRRAGVDVVWCPTTEEIYPGGDPSEARTWVDVQDLTEPLCGANRPGHFRGVTTVVTKLFLAARPDVAVFGEKDYQQLAVIRRMTSDLGFGIEVASGATVREADGLAMSSRNRRLGPRAREQATKIFESLELAGAMISSGISSSKTILSAVRKTLGEATRATIDYAELRDPDALTPAPETLVAPVLLAIAIQFESDPGGAGYPVRLIDNRVFYPARTTENVSAPSHEDLS